MCFISLFLVNGLFNKPLIVNKAAITSLYSINNTKTQITLSGNVRHDVHATPKEILLKPCNVIK